MLRKNLCKDEGILMRICNCPISENSFCVSYAGHEKMKEESKMSFFFSVKCQPGRSATKIFKKSYSFDLTVLIITQLRI